MVRAELGSDFAKIVDILDKHAVSFVSVTQQFNTTLAAGKPAAPSSMGRLTLSILLSFALFEREVTGERIRDKIAASKKKGMWMGGLPALGYDVNRGWGRRPRIPRSHQLLDRLPTVPGV
jgi:site-specific DNA recombinase